MVNQGVVWSVISSSYQFELSDLAIYWTDDVKFLCFSGLRLPQRLTPFELDGLMDVLDSKNLNSILYQYLNPTPQIGSQALHDYQGRPNKMSKYKSKLSPGFELVKSRFDCQQVYHRHFRYGVGHATTRPRYPHKKKRKIARFKKKSITNKRYFQLETFLITNISRLLQTIFSLFCLSESQSIKLQNNFNAMD